MHVGFFSPSWPPGVYPNGIVTYVAQMRDALEALGHRVTVMTGDAGYGSDGGRVALPTSLGPIGTMRDRLGRLYGKLVGAVPQGGQTLAHAAHYLHRRDRFDVFEMEESFGWSRVVQSRLDIPVVTRLHGPHFLGQMDPETAEEARRSRSRCRTEAAAIRSAAGLTAPSARLLETTRGALGLPADTGAFIPNPIRVDEAARWSPGDCDRSLILCVGRFDRRKGADIVLGAFTELCRTDRRARLVMVGADNGIRMPDGTRRHYAAYAAEHVPPEVRDRIDYRGIQSPEEIARLRSRAGLTVVGSRFENFPYSIAEAMAHGSPIVATDVYGNGEMIQHGVTGWLVTNEDRDALAKAMAWVLAHPDKAATAAAAGRERCREIYAAARIAKLTERYYAEVIAGRRA